MRVLLAAMLVMATPAWAQDENIAYIAILKGQCEDLSIIGRDYTAQCKGGVVNVAYRSGRSSFGFVSGDLGITFTGRDSRAVGNTASIAVDNVTIHKGSKPPQSHDVGGTCIYSNPYAGVPSRVNCSADEGVANIRGVFKSDGKPPELRKP